jgi:tetratricopeptide (TPR) repeat protein
LAHLHEAEALAATLDEPNRLGQVAIHLSRHFYFRGAYDESRAAAQRALNLVTADGDVVLAAVANQRLGLPYGTQGDYRRAIDYLRQSLAFFEGVQALERFGQTFLPAVLSSAHLAWWNAELGRFAEGRDFGDEGLRIAEAVAHPGSLMMASWGMGLLTLRQGDLPRALPQLERAIGICQNADLPAYAPRVAAALGAAYTLGGRAADAVALLMQAMEQTAAMELIVFQALCGISLGEAHLRAGSLEEAYTVAEHTLTLSREHRERGNEAYALRLLGDIAACHHPLRTEEAEIRYRQSLGLAEELGMRPLVAHCHHGLGTMYAKVGRPEQARTKLSAAIELYRAMEMTFWLPQAEALLAQMGAPGPTGRV